jgi:hypothetical protein
MAEAGKGYEDIAQCQNNAYIENLRYRSPVTALDFFGRTYDNKVTWYYHKPD